MCRITGQGKKCVVVLSKGAEAERVALSRKHYRTKERCHSCKKPFQPHRSLGWNGTHVVVVTEKTSWFRGDDEINYYHPGCFRAGDLRP